MSYGVDDAASNPHMNYEPSLARRAARGRRVRRREYGPVVCGRLMQAPIERQNDYAQAGQRYRRWPTWERDDLVLNLIDLLGQCDKHIQERMVWHFSQCDEDYGRRVAEGLGISVNA